MKTKFNYLLLAALATTLCIGNTYSQSFIKKSGTATRFEYGDKLSDRSYDGSLAESDVSQKALIAFSKSFPDASNAKWFKLGKKYGVDFTKNEKQYKCLFNAKGNLIYSLFYGLEEDLPRDIRKDVKREYIDYKITQAAEAHEDNRDVWIINLDDADSFITVAVEDGSIEELSRYAKAKK